MRIFSKFHDYYDIGLKYGIDPNCIYSRVTSSVDKESDQDKIIKVIEELSTYDYKSFHRVSGIDDFVFIVFCGKLYFAIRMVRNVGYQTTEVEYIYDYDSYEKYVKKYHDKKDWDKFFDLGGWTQRKLSAKTFMDIFPIKHEKLINLLIDFGTPIIMLHTSGRKFRVEINPRLKDTDFYRAVDPYSAFQELSMFVSGVMGGTAPPMIQISDVVRLEKKGFDKVTSFRNMK